MGYYQHSDIRVLIDKGWRVPTERQWDALGKVCEEWMADYLRESEQIKWYSEREDIAAFAVAIRSVVMTESIGEDGQEWRFYAHPDGRVTFIEQTRAWPDSPEWARVGVIGGQR